MTSILARICSAVEKRAAYRRTVAELSRIEPARGIEDLGIYPGDARRIARAAVYGA
ncbi:hypothetical protein roselon_03610 [Roseibacterium elongatum DSM 19469]|uniref:DUF1127 domain-containing protein n=1 Tax=Roseicyclus elongatus DSM 19469 TaxID=1294273 RepID=W8RXB6_9RHOB|nr:hypothetical protein [Roseibacterium elongatum]AHM05854.1 hypothetical protein roselon_03610 [Roseibacterium elongatum DSM 19469]